MPANPFVRGALASAVGLMLLPSPANALVIARVTRHGYIIVDEEGADPAYSGEVPVGSTPTFPFIAETTQLLAEYEGAPQGEFLAVMQTTFSSGPGRGLAYYEGLRNNVTGIGFTSPLGGGREIFDLNPIVGSAFPLTGFVWLNSLQLYDTAGGKEIGEFVICPQEFGHRFGTKIRIPAYPAPIVSDAGTDAGGPDESAGDATVADASPDDAASVPDGESADVTVADAVSDAPVLPALAVDALLGRQRAHWSYFVNSGGSPMEGNNWQDIGGGSFRTATASGRFSMLDLYLMGVALPSEVPPFFVIAEPDVRGQRDETGAVINRESPTDRGRPTTIRGRRVDYTIDDVIRANGRRVPAYIPGAGRDGGTGAPSDLQVMWVLLAHPEEVNARLADRFDLAIESCSAGYGNATRDRSHLIALSAPVPADAGTDAGEPDAAATDARADVGADSLATTDVIRSDARDGSADASNDSQTVAFRGCGCSVPARSGPHGRLVIASGTAIAAGLLRRRRGRRGASASAPH